MTMKNTIGLSSTSQILLEQKHRRCQSDPIVPISDLVSMEREGEDPPSLGSMWENLPDKLRPSMTRRLSCRIRQSSSLVCLSDHFQESDVVVENNDQRDRDEPGAKLSSSATICCSPKTVKIDLTHQADIATALPLAAVPERTEETWREDILDAIDVSDWTTVSAILETNPQLARYPVSMVVQGENSTCLLVHLLAGLKDTPVSVIDQLVTLHPSSLLQAESRAGRLPVHIAVVKESHPELVRYLCQARPQALQTPDQEGNLPMHYASMYGSSREVFQTLLHTYPQACAHANTRDRFPIHLVCARCYDEDENENDNHHQKPTVPTEDLEAIIQAHPPALRQLDRFGRTPLHLACNVLHPQWQLLQLLIEYEPECLLLKDKAKQTPLQCARKGKRRGNDLVVASLLEATHKERKRQNKGRWFIALHSSSSLSHKDQSKDLYCCYG